MPLGKRLTEREVTRHDRGAQPFHGAFGKRLWTFNRLHGGISSRRKDDTFH
jgi:hypothetical protein